MSHFQFHRNYRQYIDDNCVSICSQKMYLIFRFHRAHINIYSGGKNIRGINVTHGKLVRMTLFQLN